MSKDAFSGAFRRLRRNFLFSFITVGGLAIALAAAMLALLFVDHETSYDQWLKDADRIHGVESKLIIPGAAPMIIVAGPGRLRSVLPARFEEVEMVVRAARRPTNIRLDDELMRPAMLFADQEFFDFFGLPLTHGDPRTVLSSPNAIVLGETLATKLFGETDVVGRSLLVGDQTTAVVTGIFRDLPENTHMSFAAVMPISPTLTPNLVASEQSWMAVTGGAYVKLRQGADPIKLEAAINQLIQADLAQQSSSGKMMLDVEIGLLPVTDMHLATRGLGAQKPSGYMATIIAFSAVALLVLVLATINYTNLATVQSMRRMRELALRKTMGATRRHLALQVLGQSLVTILVAFFAALALAEMALPFFNQAIDRQLSLDVIAQPLFFAQILAFFLVVGVIGGLYPAFLATTASPVAIFRGAKGGGGHGRYLRGALLLIQFAGTTGLIIYAGTMRQQTGFMRTMDLGFDKEQLVVLKGIPRERGAQQLDTLLDSLRRIPGVVAAGASMDVPGPRYIKAATTVRAAKGADMTAMDFQPVDRNFFQVYGVTPLAGRLFDPTREADIAGPVGRDGDDTRPAGAVILNSGGVRHLGLGTPAEAVGQTIYVGDRAMTVIGVVPDIHVRAAHEAIEPYLYLVDPSHMQFVTLRLGPGAPDTTLREIDRAWTDMFPQMPVNRSFLSADLDALYADDARLGRLLAAASGLALIIAALGIFGIAAMTVEHRYREIAVRKVLGASSGAIVRLLAWQFARPVLLANLIAWPVAAYFSQQWLNGFAYRVELTVMPFAVATALALAVALATVAVHASHAARVHPRQILRDE